MVSHQSRSLPLYSHKYKPKYETKFLIPAPWYIYKVIFTIANLIVADAFTPQTRGLAGAVFNTIAEFGTSLGLTIFAIISAGVTRDSSIADKQSPEALMVGYRAVFWTCFGLMLGACGVGLWGLRNVGRIGLKRE